MDTKTIWHLACLRHPELEKLEPPTHIEVKVPYLLVVWGVNLDAPLDFKRVLYRFKYDWRTHPQTGSAIGLVWERDSTMGAFWPDWVACDPPTRVEVCKQLKKRGVRSTPLDGALSLCGDLGGNLSMV